MTGPARRFVVGAACALAVFPPSSIVLAQQYGEGPKIELTAEASRRAANDLAIAMAYYEATDADPAALSRRVNAAIAAAFELGKAYDGVQVSSAGVSTWPVHTKDGRSIQAWRMRSTIRLESRDIPALSELLGKLQETLAVSSLAMQPAPETRMSTADLAAIDAIRAFQARAKTIADTFDRAYRIRNLSINYGGMPPPVVPMMRAGAFAAEAAPAPLEGGESDVVVGVTGTIELTD